MGKGEGHGSQGEPRAEGLEGIRIPEEQGAVGKASAEAQDWDQLGGQGVSGVSRGRWGGQARRLSRRHPDPCSPCAHPALCDCDLRQVLSFTVLICNRRARPRLLSAVPVCALVAGRVAQPCTPLSVTVF